MLIGDAAHAVSPNAGQGASLALEDAMYLAKLLRDCPDHPTAFACFEQDRKPRVERIVAAGRRRHAMRCSRITRAPTAAWTALTAARRLLGGTCLATSRPTVSPA